MRRLHETMPEYMRRVYGIHFEYLPGPRRSPVVDDEDEVGDYEWESAELDLEEQYERERAEEIIMREVQREAQ